MGLSSMKGWLLLATLFVTASAMEEETYSASDLACAVMLLGSISFMMGVFYLTNHSDDDFKMYSWNTISSTISIFCAVLLFQGVQGVVEYQFLEEGENDLTVAFLHLMAWCLLLQLSLAFISGAVSFPCCDSSSEENQEPLLEALDVEDQDAQQQLYLEEESKKISMGVSMSSVAVLAGHITGFAAISAWGELQQMKVLGPDLHLLWTWLVVPLTFLGLSSFFKLTFKLRERVFLMDDEKDYKEEAWDEYAKETEDDVIGLAISFLCVQCLRFTIVGKLPNVEGEEEGKDASHHSNLDALILFLTSLIFVAVQAVKSLIWKSDSRMGAQISNIVSMAISWTLFFTIQWEIDANAPDSVQGMLKKVYQAIIVTGVCFCSIFFIDKLADADWTGEETDKMLRTIILSFGILIGFSWEQCFDISVAIFSHVHGALKPVAIMKLVLSVGLCTVVVPAWVFYILPVVVQYEVKEKEEEEKEKAEEEIKEKIEAIVQTQKNATKLDDVARLKELRAWIRKSEQKHLELKKRAEQYQKDADEHKKNANMHQSSIGELRAQNFHLKGLMKTLPQEILEIHKLVEGLTTA
eukprot:CAMPEP_0170614816 /NCGR_PEP_ID=MMETSP0224-20130122/25006_1 /TAXON_ID=285029 /ORGANISM="Togula jolla, Strain CCCM 725" /LENGTH=580 /DNA_ID=CAMNT_0010940507 /DNA_START=12 /DNA_END=1754 /DNA_ORIENTATION=-